MMTQGRLVHPGTPVDEINLDNPEREIQRKQLELAAMIGGAHAAGDYRLVVQLAHQLGAISGPLAPAGDPAGSDPGVDSEAAT